MKSTNLFGGFCLIWYGSYSILVSNGGIWVPRPESLGFFELASVGVSVCCIAIIHCILWMYFCPCMCLQMYVIDNGIDGFWFVCL